MRWQYLADGAMVSGVGTAQENALSVQSEVSVHHPEVSKPATNRNVMGFAGFFSFQMRRHSIKEWILEVPKTGLRDLQLPIDDSFPRRSRHLNVMTDGGECVPRSGRSNFQTQAAACRLAQGISQVRLHPDAAGLPVGPDEQVFHAYGWNQQ